MFCILCDVAGANSYGKTPSGSCCSSQTSNIFGSPIPHHEGVLIQESGEHTHLMKGRAEGEGRDNIGSRSPLLLVRRVAALPPPHLLGHLKHHLLLQASFLNLFPRTTTSCLKRQLHHRIIRTRGDESWFSVYATQSLVPA